ncbi:MAG: Do family serine endopeptidase [Muribaculaceae bacterium]|jgi:Do/DeqQ family serine protease|nr:Do family serine endopeptidase [Muribaculaceae bacterium]
MKKTGMILLASCAVAVASSLTTAFVMRAAGGSHDEDNFYSAQSEPRDGGNFYTVGSVTTPATDFTSAAESTVNGVVSIKSYATPRSQMGQGGGGYDPFYEFFFGTPSPRQQPRRQQQQPQQLGLGSGVILSEDGYIVTNNHVVEGAEMLEVTLNDNRSFNATVIGTDPSTDLALVKIEADSLHVIPIGDSEGLKVGEWVLAVGNPFGFTSTVTTGIVSAKGRNISSITRSGNTGIESYIQTDAAVNPGNSGGALVNLAGELVGINTAIYSQTGNFAGYSFAVPTSIVKKVVTDIKQYGAVQRAFLGVLFSELTPQIAKEKNITATTSGLYVGEVQERSAAMEAGLKEGDVIVAINGNTTTSTGQLQEAMAKLRPGDKAKVTFYRDNKKETVTVTLRNNQGTTNVTKAGTVTDLGCAFKAISPETRRQLGISSGVQVSGLQDGRFRRAGIKEGFIITDINNSRVASADDVEKIYDAIMKSADGYDKVMFITGLYPTGKKMYYAVDLVDGE